MLLATRWRRGSKVNGVMVRCAECKWDLVIGNVVSASSQGISGIINCGSDSPRRLWYLMFHRVVQTSCGYMNQRKYPSSLFPRTVLRFPLSSSCLRHIFGSPATKLLITTDIKKVVNPPCDPLAVFRIPTQDMHNGLCITMQSNPPIPKIVVNPIATHPTTKL
jgi:hypothetical protein